MNETEVKALLSSKRQREAEAKTHAAAASSATFDDPWNMHLKLAIPCSIPVHDHANRTITVTRVELPPIYCTVRPLQDGDEDALVQFGLRGLSAESRRILFTSSDSWDGPMAALAIANSQSRRDLHLVAVSNERICAHAYLRSMHDDDENIPELRIAVADAWHGRGLARQLLALSERVCVAEGKLAIEVITMADPGVAAAAHALFSGKAGYEYLGRIRTLHVTTAASGGNDDAASRSSTRVDATERQLCRILDESARAAVMAEMKSRRERAAV